ncbi:MAG: transposase, partial [Bdellovibrionales bacterium]|nr:transposase [Bdellovibrionales bacterium]
MKYSCPDLKCQSQVFSSPDSEHIIRFGTFFRKSDSRHIDRFRCMSCKRTFSRSTFLPNYRHKVRRITHPLNELLYSGVSQRRSAMILGVARSTISRRFRYLGERAKHQNQKHLRHYENHPAVEIEFDDLETHEHTKCKPLSVSLVVEAKTRKILGFRVSRMPAKGRLSKLALKKYGPRPDERGIGWKELLSSVRSYVSPAATITSDDNPHYPKVVRRQFPEATHIRVKGGRAAITGQGELKKLKYDPIFSLNHTCAMLRANLNRLFRRTWCTTKTIQGLIDHLSIYVAFHNR